MMVKLRSWKRPGELSSMVVSSIAASRVNGVGGALSYVETVAPPTRYASLWDATS